ncbi:MAG: 3-phosphoshikimate 1-carboxyvinyltransferase [Fimbriimonadaceae bacterium]|nr:3-phosphoshikimate 1-carboxyvinyltransferase [Fimbriimonadaceae bacterium]
MRPPSDKSLTHRAYILAAMAKPGSASVIDAGEAYMDVPGGVSFSRIPGTYESTIQDSLRGEDCEATLECLKALGRFGEHLSATETRIFGGPEEWHSPESPLDCGNSGTTMRLLCGVLAGLPGVEARLVGDASLTRRPMGRVAEPLRQMGASIVGESSPLEISGKPLRAIDYQSKVASAQVKSCVLLAGLNATGTTWTSEPALSRDHTERMLTALGVELQRSDLLRVGVEGGQVWGGFNFRVPADISSAAFWMVAAACTPGARVTLQQVGVNQTRTGILDVFEQTGVKVEIHRETEELGEPVADLTVTGPAELKPFHISGDLVPRLIDEIPVLAVLATQATGQSTIRDARELRVKESDRIAKIAEGLGEMGARVETFEDGLSIVGKTALSEGTIVAGGDHRIAMSFAIAGSLASGTTTIVGAESIATSYPDFFEHYDELAKSE